MRTLIALLLLNTSAMAAWPSNQAVLFTTADCKPCVVLKADLEKCKAVVSPANDAHFILRQAPPELKVAPVIVYFDENGKAIATHVGYVYTLPYEQRRPELLKIVRKHPMLRPKKATMPPMAPPVTETVAYRSAPVRTANLWTMKDNGEVEWSRDQGLTAVELGKGYAEVRQNPRNQPLTVVEFEKGYAEVRRKPIQTVQYAPFSADCSGSQAFYAPPAQSYAVPFSDCGGGGGIGGGDDFFEPQSAYAPQYGLSYSQPYLSQYVPRQYTPRTYVVRASPRATWSPQFGGGGINNFSLINLQPQLGLGSLFGGGLFSQRAYYAPRRSYRAAYSPFSYASYGQSSRMVCGPSGCVMY